MREGRTAIGIYNMPNFFSLLDFQAAGVKLQSNRVNNYEVRKNYEVRNRVRIMKCAGWVTQS
jgi:hypothetical protein